MGVGPLILIADDHPLFRQALTLAVRTIHPAAEVIEAGDLHSAQSAAEAHRETLKLVLLDLQMPGAVGYSGVAVIHATAPEVPILVISGADPAKAAYEAQHFGAVGYLGKDADLSRIEMVVDAALSGTLEPLPAPPVETDATAQKLAALTPMQLKVLTFVLGGMLNKQIAYELGLSEATVKAHMTAIMRKLDVRNRTQAALVARSLGLDLRH